MRTQAICPLRVHEFVSSIFDADLHAKRVASLADATVGALEGAQLAVGALGRALAVASVATDDPGPLFHRDHRDPGARPVARRQSSPALAPRGGVIGPRLPAAG